MKTAARVIDLKYCPGKQIMRDKEQMATCRVTRWFPSERTYRLSWAPLPPTTPTVATVTAVSVDVNVFYAVAVKVSSTAVATVAVNNYCCYS